MLSVFACFDALWEDLRKNCLRLCNTELCKKKCSSLKRPGCQITPNYSIVISLRVKTITVWKTNLRKANFGLKMANDATWCVKIDPYFHFVLRKVFMILNLSYCFQCLINRFWIVSFTFIIHSASWIKMVSLSVIIPCSVDPKYTNLILQVKHYQP